MIWNLSQLKNGDNVVITHSDEAFAGTELATRPFSITIKKLNRVEKIDTLQQAVNSDGEFSNGEYSRALFIKSIDDVDGMVDEAGNMLTIEDGIREIIWEYGSDVLVERIKEAISSFTKTDEKKSEQAENDLENSPHGV